MQHKEVKLFFVRYQLFLREVLVNRIALDEFNITQTFCSSSFNSDLESRGISIAKTETYY